MLLEVDAMYISLTRYLLMDNGGLYIFNIVNDLGIFHEIHQNKNHFSIPILIAHPTERARGIEIG